MSAFPLPESVSNIRWFSNGFPTFAVLTEQVFLQIVLLCLFPVALKPLRNTRSSLSDAFGLRQIGVGSEESDLLLELIESEKGNSR